MWQAEQRESLGTESVRAPTITARIMPDPSLSVLCVVANSLVDVGATRDGVQVLGGNFGDDGGTAERVERSLAREEEPERVEDASDSAGRPGDEHLHTSRAVGLP